MAFCHFHKYSALGNDMLVLDPRTLPFTMTAERARRICQRHYGIGADGICYGPLPDEPPFAMRFYNPDGSLAETSGNGLRVFARYLRDQAYASGHSLEIMIGGRACQVDFIDGHGEGIRIDMGRASFQSRQFPSVKRGGQITLQVGGQLIQATCVSLGNPHCVIGVDKLDRDQVKALGPAIEARSAFPERVNAQWMRVLDRRRIAIEIWERGAGYTLSSGSSACAAACAAIMRGHCDSPVTVEMAGGRALVEVDQHWRARLTGTVAPIYSGRFSLEFAALLSRPAR